MQKFLKDALQLQNVCLIPSKKIPNILWNNYGGLLGVLSNILGIDPAVALSILNVESNGKGFENGRMIIRFENHIFWKYWGKNHQEEFNKHFKFSKIKPWQEHEFRKNPNTELWVYFHQLGQQREWLAFEFAKQLDIKAAIDSISMGMPQIMGFNYKRIGYKSEQEMFDVFSESEKNQIVGLFDFIGIGTKMCFALQNKDFLTFAKLYNGSGNAIVYSNRIKTTYDSLDTLLKE